MLEDILQFLMVRGLKDVSMDDVAAYLNKSKATIYKYFRSREEIVRMGLEYKLERLKDFVPVLMNRGEKKLDYLDRYFKAIQLFSEEVSDISNLFLSDLKEVFPDLWGQVKGFQDFASIVLNKFYQEGMEAGILKQMNPAILVMSDRFLFDALSEPSFLTQHNVTIGEVFQEYFEMKFFGIVAHPD